MKKETNLILNAANQEKMEERINTLVGTVESLAGIMSTDDMENFIRIMDLLKKFQIDPDAGLFSHRVLVKDCENSELTVYYQGVYASLKEICDSYLVDNNKDRKSAFNC